MNKYLIFFIIFFWTGTLYAASGTGMGAVASNMMEPVTIFSDFITSACLILGICFILASVIKYSDHRKNPLMTPISTVLFLLVLGLLLLILPAISYFSPSAIQYSLFKNKEMSLFL